MNLHSPAQECEDLEQLKRELVQKRKLISALSSITNEEIESLRKALEFYAYEAQKETGIFARGTLWDEDKGKLARETLNKQKGE
jgi:hypothetical protein